MGQTRTISARKGSESEDAPAPKRRRITKRKALENHARSYFEAIAERDVERMLEHWDEDGVVDLVPLGIYRGHAGIREFFTELFTALPDMQTTVKRVAAGEHEVAVEWRASGTFTGGPFQGVEPNGRTVEIRGVDMVEIVNGKILSNTAYYDGMAFARAIGVLPPADSGAERAIKGAVNAATRVKRAVADGREALAQRRNAE
jgi:steroid delta-isomerase-like uncharacterized protein